MMVLGDGAFGSDEHEWSPCEWPCKSDPKELPRPFQLCENNENLAAYDPQRGFSPELNRVGTLISNFQPPD